MEELASKIMEYMNKMERKITKEELRQKLGVKGEKELSFFNSAIAILEENGEIFLDSKGYYHIFDENLEVVQGKILINKNGDGYINAEETYFIKKENLNGALPNDIVIIKPIDKTHYGKKCAKVCKIIRRNTYHEIYKYISDGLFSIYGVKSNVYLKIDAKKCTSYVPRTLIIAAIDKTPLYSDHDMYVYSGEITNAIGHADDPKAQITAIGLKHGFNHKFSNKIINDCQKISTNITPKEINNRIDLRNEITFTIDGIDTKDIDDAISINYDGEKYNLKVHIADVSHYVKDNNELVKEAVNRGNSAYLADSVFPMFPHILSNGICSLNANEDRLCKTVSIIIDNDGNIIDYQIYKSVINSNMQMNYDSVNKVFNNKSIEEYNQYKNKLMLIKKLSSILTSKSRALDFSSREIKIKTNEQGEVTTIKNNSQHEAEKVIENFMILANRCVTEYYGYLGFPFIYRVHGEPDIEKLKNALAIIKKQDLGHEKNIDKIIKHITKSSENKSDINPSVIKQYLSSINNENYYEAVSNMLLKCMSKAHYSNENIGHFGLDINDYSHFTSPIRRAADLINHIIIDYIEESYQGSYQALEKLEHIRLNLYSICNHISNTEIMADKAEREVNKIKKIEYFSKNIDLFEGPIESKVTYIDSNGVWIIIDNIYECKISSIDLNNNSYVFKKESRTYVTKEDTIKLGQILYVSIPFIDKEMNEINYTRFSKVNNLVDKREKIKTKKI